MTKMLAIVVSVALWPAIALADCATITLPPLAAVRPPLNFTFVGQTCVTLVQQLLSPPGAAGPLPGWVSGRAPALDPSGDRVTCVVNRQPLQRSWVCFEHK
jgi:hypothetical protein